MDNAEILKSLGITYETTRGANKLANMFYKVNSTEKIEVYYLRDGKRGKYNISPRNYHIAFVNEIWRELTTMQRLRVLKWHETEFLTKSGYAGDIPEFRFITDEDYGDISYCALAKKNEGLLLKLDFIQRSKGLDALTIITHECIHYLDFEKFDLTYKKYMFKYLKYHYAPDNELLYKEIMQLPVEGKILNIKTGEMDFITEEMRNDFLFLKNHVVCFCKHIDTPFCQRNANTKEYFEHYLAEMFYYTSPLERRAYLGSLDYTRGIVDRLEDKYPVNEIDKKLLNNNNKLRLKVLGKVREIQKGYRMSHYNAINLELVNLYNHVKFGKSKRYYICKDLMKKRDEVVKFLWEKKYRYYGNGEPWDNKEK